MAVGTQVPAQKPTGKAQAAPPPARPFRAGVQSMEDAQYDNSYQLTAGTHDMPDFNLNGDGFLRGIWCLFEGVTAGNAATVTFAQNGPFNVIDTIQFLDTSGRPTLGPFDGYTLAQVDKWGSYFNQNDPRRDTVYNAVAGAGSTGGSFTFLLYIPIEIVSRDGLGSLVNKNTAVPYKVKLRFAATATAYGTPPTTAPTVRARMVQDNWWEPEPADAKGHPLTQKPPQVNTTQFWASNNYQGLGVGALPGQQLSTGLGYPLRNIIFMLTDSLNSRVNGESSWPDPVTLTVEKNQLFVRAKNIWKSRISKAYDLKSISGTNDVADALENGVYPLWFTQDFVGQPGMELRNGYLITRGGQNFLFTGTLLAGSSTPPFALYTFVNWVAAANGDPASLSMGGR
jgi:hypothetical protein